MTTPSLTRLPVAQGVQLTLNLVHGSQVAAVVLGGTLTGAPEPSNAMAEAWRDAFWTPMKALVLGTVTCTGAVLRRTAGFDAPVFEIGPPAAAVGTNTGTAAVAAGSVLIKWTTSRGGRTGKGRTYLPGLSASDMGTDGRTYASALGPRVTTAVNAYLTSSSLASAGVAPAVLSFTKGHSSPITGGALATIVGVQRRRMRA